MSYRDYLIWTAAHTAHALTEAIRWRSTCRRRSYAILHLEAQARHSEGASKSGETTDRVAPRPSFEDADVTKAALRKQAKTVLDPLDHWATQCHAASVELVKSDGYEQARVARGGCTGVVRPALLGRARKRLLRPIAVIVDPTLWSYEDERRPGVWAGG